jgi:hypothetical protein
LWVVSARVQAMNVKSLACIAAPFENSITSLTLPKSADVTRQCVASTCTKVAPSEGVP